MAEIDHTLLMALMDTVPDRIYFKDCQGHFLSVNQAMKNFLQVHDDASIQGKTDRDFFLSPHAKAAFADEQQVIETGRPMIAKLEREDLPNGQITWVSTTKVPMRNAEGQIIGTCGISRDVTAEHARAEKFAEFTEELKLKQAQMEQELALARQVQQALLPQEYPVLPRGATRATSALRFSHRYLPEAPVGGDFFNIIKVSDSQVGVLVCDVMGHGVHAALITAVQRVLVEEIQEMAGDPGQFLGELNRRLHHFFEPLPSSMFVTALYVVVDSVTGQVAFASASHPAALHLCRRTQELRTLDFSQATPPFALGVVPSSVYTTHFAQVEPDDLIFLFTDGLFELGEGKDLLPDDPRFLRLIQNCSRQKGEAFLDAVLEQARQFAGVDHFFDDVCLVGIEIERLASQGV